MTSIPPVIPPCAAHEAALPAGRRGIAPKRCRAFCRDDTRTGQHRLCAPKAPGGVVGAASAQNALALPMGRSRSAPPALANQYTAADALTDMICAWLDSLPKGPGRSFEEVKWARVDLQPCGPVPLWLRDPMAIVYALPPLGAALFGSASGTLQPGGADGATAPARPAQPQAVPACITPLGAVWPTWEAHVFEQELDQSCR